MRASSMFRRSLQHPCSDEPGRVTVDYNGRDRFPDFKPMRSLVGERIVLRNYLPSDAECIYRWRNDTETTRWMGPKFRTCPTLSEVEESLTKIINEPPEDGLFFAIAGRESLRYIGGIDLTSIEETDRNAVLSIVIGCAADRNKGYGSEALGLLLRHAFKEMWLHRVSLNVYEENKAAVRCYVKNGFRMEGRRREQTLVNGRYIDLVQMGLLESEYPGK